MRQMQELLSGRYSSRIGPRVGSVFASALMTFSMLCAPGFAHAQAGKLGAYTGTINATGKDTAPQVSYKVSAKVTLPVTERKANSVTSEFLAGEAPNAKVLISQWDEFHKNSSPDSDGKISGWTCALAAPVDIPMTATGVLDVDLKAKKHTLSITLLSTSEIAFNCVHSRSGPYKAKHGIALTMGTGAPGMQSQTPLPFTDPAVLSARHTLVPPPGTAGHGPVVQDWDLRFTR
ncbi:MAG: hypothetical protein ABL931_08740 [Usitatibacteraceae bacterium]